MYCLMSDGEWNEGSCWEALIFARHHRLDNLTILVDLNGLQGFGTTREVADLDPWRRSSGRSACRPRRSTATTPRRSARRCGPTAAGPTRSSRGRVKGCGVSFMEDRMEWHYLPLTEAQYRQAVEEIERHA